MLHLGKYVKAKEILTLCEIVKSYIYSAIGCQSIIPAEDQHNLLHKNAIEYEKLLTELFLPKGGE